MVKRLDDKFGNSVKLTDSVISEIKALKPVVEGNSKRFVDMVNTVERCWLDLKKMGLSSGMNTTTMVTQVERLLPATQKREWVLVVQDLPDRSKLFEELLKFLLREKTVIEYMDNELRVTSSSKAMVLNCVNEENGEVTGLATAIKQ
ncbi:hypothetical protein Pmani_029055 [Petrolisthes manimaculis]|uniref:Uncharacterized protein n=1 Tax=Petrolisthes manimaculis TaxID=1843537 RepID=A0AAE1P056_9EUCA|nr:hypothetical protein Pmani_029055 [Petrolisthes manimaculis]